MIAVLALVALLFIAGCGSDDDAETGVSVESTSTAAKPSGGRPAVVTAGEYPGLGRVMVEGRGFTLYAFREDPARESTCHETCAKVWLPLITGADPDPGEWVEPAKIGTIERSIGIFQVTYAGRPLYTYSADRKPGDVTGNGIDSFGGEWFALRPKGQELLGTAAEAD